MGVIQKQSIQSSVVIMVGFIIGAMNILVLFPYFFSRNDMGLVRAIIDTGTTLAVLCSLGTLPVIYKFYPFHNHYLGVKKNDLPVITLAVNLAGFCILLFVGWWKKDFIVTKLGKSPDFAANFSHIYPYVFFLLVFSWLEPFAWGLKKGVYTYFLREVVIRILTTLLVLAFGFGYITMPVFVTLFSFLYVIPTGMLLYALTRSKQWKLNKLHISSVTRRLGRKMLSFSMFVFLGQFFNTLAKTNDTFLVFGLRGLSDTSIFAIATYVAAILEVPQRSLNAISIPILADSWKNKDFANISHIYHKSVSNLLVIGLFLFGLICLNIETIVSFLNLISRKETGGYDALTKIIFILGMGRLVDLATGANSQIIGTSNYWKFDFYTNLFHILLSLPLNFYLIKYYGLEGLAYANLFAQFLYNLMRYLFLYKKYQLQPYTFRHLLFLVLSLGIMFITYHVADAGNFIVNAALRSVMYTGLFLGILFWINPASDMIDMAKKFFMVQLPAIFGIKK